MAKNTGLSQTAVVRIWRAFGLQPHRVENFTADADVILGKVEKLYKRISNSGH